MLVVIGLDWFNQFLNAYISEDTKSEHKTDFFRWNL